MRTMDFMAFVTRLVAEDIMWLKDYMSTLTSWHCIGFFALCLLYVLIMKVIEFLAGLSIKWAIRTLGVSNKFIENLSFKLSASNPDFLRGYEEGYRAGINYKEPSWWETTILNPFNWFK